MSFNKKFSPLLDTLVLETDVAKGIPSIWDSFPKINWYSTLINFIIPFSIFLIVAFILKSRYDHKKQLNDEFIIV